MKILISLFILFSLYLINGDNSKAQVKKIVGGQINCDNCIKFPTNFLILCEAGDFVQNCPQTFHPSFVDNNRFWGETFNGFNEICVTSIDGGDNWILCTTQPFNGEQLRIASSSNGNVIAIASVSNKCTIRYSSDNAFSWITVFIDIEQCSVASGSAQTLICQPIGGRCDFIFGKNGIGYNIYVTFDNGLTWVKNIINNTNADSIMSIYFDGTIGVGAPTTGLFNRVVPLATGSVWSVSTGWPSITGSYSCSGSSFYSDVGLVIFCYDVTNNNYKQISPSGVVYKTFIPVNAKISGTSNITGLEWSSGISYLVGFNSVGNQAIWISTDNLNTTTLIATINVLSGLATMFKVNNAIYISIAGTSGAFYKISI